MNFTRGQANLFMLVIVLVGAALWTRTADVRPQPTPPVFAHVEGAASPAASPNRSQNRRATLDAFSVDGVLLAMNAQEVYRLSEIKSDVHPPAFALVDQNGNTVISFASTIVTVWEATDLVYIVTGSQLERDGKPLLKAGDSLEQAISRLGVYASKPGGLYFDYGPVTVQVHATGDHRVEKFTLYYDEFLSHQR